MLIQVRSVNVSLSSLRLEPTRGRPEAASHPLRRLHIELGDLSAGLPDGALQGLGRLETVSLDKVHVERAVRSALADLPRLRELSITDSVFEFFNTGVVTRVPRLRRLRFARSTFSFMGADAIVVENDNDDDMEGSGTSAAGDDDSFLEFTNMGVNTMNTNAVRVASVRRLVVSGSAIGTMYAGALNVTLYAPAELRPLAHFTRNNVTDMRADALALENEAARPAHLELGANWLLRSPLSPVELQLRGDFERRPVAGLARDRFDCTCCECPGTHQLIQLALQPRPSQLDTDVFVAALGQALCAGPAARSFLQFASDCAPDADLTARVSALVTVPPPPPPPPSGAAAWRPAVGPMLALPLLLAAARRG